MAIHRCAIANRNTTRRVVSSSKTRLGESCNIEGEKASPSAKAPYQLTPPTSEYTLLNLVQTMVEPDSWSRDGPGGEGRAEVINGILIVHQTESVLRQIGEMLKDLRGKVLGETAEIVAAPERKKKAGQAKRNGHTDDEGFKWVIDAFEKCTPTAEKCGVLMELENHWGLGRTAEGVLRIVKQRQLFRTTL